MTAAPIALRAGEPIDGLLTVDRGNTTLDCRCVVGARALRRRLPGDLAALDQLLAELRARDGRPPRAAALVSVVPGALAPLEQRLTAAGIAVLVAGRELSCPLELAYRDPAELGADRWVGALAAQRRYGDAIVVDCGTAVTINAVDRGGRFLGGAIGAGLGTVAAALAQRAPALPAFDAALPDALPAITTLDAVRAGVGLLFARGVEWLVDAVVAGAPSLAGAAPQLCVTGGEAEVLARFASRPFAVHPELVHDGLTVLCREGAWLDRDSSC
ncbi:MAG: type III pantothenate kinase [Planctomycetes bacterium]|nr:type III pantothenate kinase [Planctomycetota bacterium]